MSQTRCLSILVYNLCFCCTFLHLRCHKGIIVFRN